MRRLTEIQASLVLSQWRGIRREPCPLCTVGYDAEVCQLEFGPISTEPTPTDADALLALLEGHGLL